MHPGECSACLVIDIISGINTEISMLWMWSACLIIWFIIAYKGKKNYKYHFLRNSIESYTQLVWYNKIKLSFLKKKLDFAKVSEFWFPFIFSFCRRKMKACLIFATKFRFFVCEWSWIPFNALLVFCHFSLYHTEISMLWVWVLVW